METLLEVSITSFAEGKPENYPKEKRDFVTEAIVLDKQADRVFHLHPYRYNTAAGQTVAMATNPSYTLFALIEERQDGQLAIIKKIKGFGRTFDWLMDQLVLSLQ